MMPAKNEIRRNLSVVEALRQLQGLKAELQQTPYTQVFERLKQWRLMWYLVDFSTGEKVEQIEEFEKEYRGFQELLQWRINELQQLVQEEVAKFKQKGKEGLMESDLEAAVRRVEEEIIPTIYDYGDIEDYKKDLRLLMRKEWVRLKYGEESKEYKPFLEPFKNLEKLQQQNAKLRQQQQQVLKLRKESLSKGGGENGK